MNRENAFIKETIKIIRPANMSRVFNEIEYDIVETKDIEGYRMVFMESKVQIPANGTITQPRGGNAATEELYI